MDNTQAITLSESLEDYIEVIFRTILEKNEVKPKDIAQALHVAGASVTGALRALAEKGLIQYAPYDGIFLTPQGEKVAKDIYSRHQKLKSFLKNILQVEEKEADETACRMEHAISTKIINKLVRFVEFVESCPKGGLHWIAGFEHSCDPDDSLDHCLECVRITLKRIEQVQKSRAKSNTKPN